MCVGVCVCVRVCVPRGWDVLFSKGHIVVCDGEKNTSWQMEINRLGPVCFDDTWSCWTTFWNNVLSSIFNFFILIMHTVILLCCVGLFCACCSVCVHVCPSWERKFLCFFFCGVFTNLYWGLRIVFHALWRLYGTIWDLFVILGNIKIYLNWLET